MPLRPSIKDKMAKKLIKPVEKKPKVHPNLEGFEMKIDSFGQIISSMDRDQLNSFLDKEMPGDKKLTQKDDESK
jgi:hypothetical protein